MKHSYLIASLSLLTVLTGCGGVSDSLGFGRNPPDEFAVVDRPPLAMPPDFDLRPPKPGAPRPQETPTGSRASTTLFGPNTKVTTTSDHERGRAGTAEAGKASSDAEKVLLESSGADRAEANIREVVDREAAQKVVGNKHLIDDLLWWKKTEPPATTVNAPAEAERIKEAKEKGEPVNQGATPTIERRKSGWLGM